jgi:phosphoribosylaminoimidazolecarboxamide formyltransferase/IMP cyclohydrolase
LRVLHGTPSYINLLDALTSWGLVREAAGAFDRPAATSFKHVSPAGAALDGPVDETMRETFRLGDLAMSSPVARAYVRARDADPKSSYGDFVAVSHPVDPELAAVLRKVVSDGIIAPGYEPGTLDVLRAKKQGGFLVLQADPAYAPPEHEVRELFGVRLVQPSDHTPPDRTPFAELPDPVADDLLLGMIVVKYTQSNSVAYTHAGMAIRIGAGQQIPGRLHPDRW